MAAKPNAIKTREMPGWSGGFEDGHSGLLANEEAVEVHETAPEGTDEQCSDFEALGGNSDV